MHKDIGTSVLNYTDDTFGISSARESESNNEIKMLAINLRQVSQTPIRM